jgi:hypothetical protein
MTPVVDPGQGAQSAHGIPLDDHDRTYCGKKVEGHWREVRIMVNCNRCRLTIRKMRRSAIL